MFWEIHVRHEPGGQYHNSGGWSIRHLEAPDRETAEALAFEDVFKYYSDEAREKGKARARISTATPHPNKDYLTEHRRLTMDGVPVQVFPGGEIVPLTNSVDLSYSGSKASRRRIKRRSRMTTTPEAKTEGKKAEEKKPEKEMVTIATLATESGKEARVIRRILRAGGYSAPKGEDTANRYEWEIKDPALVGIRKLIAEYGQKPPEEKKSEGDGKAAEGSKAVKDDKKVPAGPAAS